jgi:large subunit ribosomal protein L22
MKRIRPAPMGRAFRYVRRIAHIEVVLAERNKNTEGVANVVGSETATKAPVKGRAKGKSKVPAGKSKKKAVGAR